MYSVKLYATPMSFPFNFTVHTWVEISDSNTLERYEFWGYPGLSIEPINGYIYRNIFPDHLGTTWSPIANPNNLAKRQIGRVLEELTGETDSLAHKLHIAIQNEAINYPYVHTYNMVIGPNCNTYTAWLLNLVPNTKLTLPWYAWGKNFKI